MADLQTSTNTFWCVTQGKSKGFDKLPTLIGYISFNFSRASPSK